ncbi:hypothetical protein [Actinomadura verrucosospora]
MSGRREVDSAAADYVRGGSGPFSVFHLLLGIAVLVSGTFAFNAMVDEIGATRRAARGDGVQGVFTAETKVCPRGGCLWYGPFRDGRDGHVVIDRVELRGDDDRAVSAGDAVPALDVGSPDFVQAVGGAPEWGEAFGAGVLAVIAAGFGACSIAWALRGVYWSRPPRASRRAEARRRGRSVLRDLAGRDRWGWTARPGRSLVRVKVARSWGRTVAAAVVLVPAGAAAPLLLAGWFARQEGATLSESIAGPWGPVLTAVTVTVAIQALRLVLVRPRMWVSEEEIVIWDGPLLWKALRIPRSAMVAVRQGTEPDRRREKESALMTPFREEVNLLLRTRDAIRLPARRLRWGNWLWVMLTSDDGPSRPTIPQRGRPVRSLWLRVEEPRRVATDLDRWLAAEEADPPEPAPADHAYQGRHRTHRGPGVTRLKINGRLSQPLLAEFVNEGSEALEASLRRTEFGRGIPVVSCGPGAPPATTVLDDLWVAQEELARRFLHIEATGAWTVTISGPERSRSFAGSATGHGAEVLTYEGPPGVAVLSCPDGAFYEVHLRGPDLTGLYGRRAVASAGAPGPGTADGFSGPSRSTFAVPTGAVLQVRTDSTEWRIDVTPLEQADVDSAAGDSGAVPPTGHVRPFENLIAGDRAAVVRYLGPPGRVLFRGEGDFGLVQLGDTLVPLRTLVPPAGEQALELRAHTLLQVTGGSGTWSMEEAAPRPRAPTPRLPRLPRQGRRQPMRPTPP